jgi:YVTN family beta-propeller protein
MRMLVLLIIVSACSGTAPPARGRVFVSNENDGTVSVIDVAGGRVVATIAVGKRPRGLRVSRDGRSLFVALSGSPKGGPGVDERKLPAPDRSADGIGVIDLRSLRLVRTLTSGPDPESFDLTRDGGALVVSNEETAEASIVDAAKGTIRARVPVGGEPEGVATHPGGEVYVTSEADARVTVIDPVAARVVATIATGTRPRGVAFTPDGRRALISNEVEGSITIVDTKAHAPIGAIRLPMDGTPRPMGIAVSSRGDRAYVTTGRGRSVAILDLAAGTLRGFVRDVGARPWGIAFASDGRLYTANGSSNDVSVIDPKTERVVARIAVGGSPWGVATDL